jgi:hypothetical protein
MQAQGMDSTGSVPRPSDQPKRTGRFSEGHGKPDPVPLKFWMIIATGNGKATSAGNGHISAGREPEWNIAVPGNLSQA